MKAGLFGIGLDTYWPQFEGLLDRLIGNQEKVRGLIESNTVEVIDAGMVDHPDKAHSAARLFNRENVDCVFLFISTYALSHNVLPVALKLNVPIIVLNLQPEKRIDYEMINSLGDRGKMTGEWLAHCQSCVAPEIACVFNRADIPFHLVSGYIGEPYVYDEIKGYLNAVKIQSVMRENRVGLMGHYYNGMMDVYSDLTQQAATFGNHFEILEFGALKKYWETVTEKEMALKIAEFNDVFSISGECGDGEIRRAAKTSVALDKLITDHNLGSLAYYYEGESDAVYENLVTSLIPGLTLLTGNNVPVAGEYEVKNVQAMKIMDILGSGGSFSEFYALDFEDNIVLLGHDGPAHFAIADGKVGLVPLPLYHGKPGKGLSIQMKVKNGPVTLLSVCQSKEKVFLLIAEGESVEGPTLQIGNTNSRYRFSLPARDFIDQWSVAGPSHHCAIGVGHHAETLKKYASINNMDCIQIC